MSSGIRGPRPPPARETGRRCAGSMLCLVPEVTRPGWPAALRRRRASAKAKRATLPRPRLADHLEREAARARARRRDARGSGSADRGARASCEVAFRPHVEVFQVLAHDHEIDALRDARAGCARRGSMTRGAHVGVGALAPAQMQQREGALAAGGAEERRVREASIASRASSGNWLPQASIAACPMGGCAATRDPRRGRPPPPELGRTASGEASSPSTTTTRSSTHDPSSADVSSTHGASSSGADGSARRSTSSRPPARTIASMSSV